MELLSWRLFGAAVGLSVLFVAFVSPRIDGPFGNNHDGRNASQWILGAEAILDDGIGDSRLGAINDVRGTYAHHPPGMYIATTGARAISDDPLVLRSPALLSSIASIVVMLLLLRQYGFGEVAAASGTLAMVATPMFLVYGAMLNMEALSLPLGLGLLLVLARDARRATLVLAAAGAIVSFTNIAFMGVLGLVVAVDAIGKRRIEPRYLYGAVGAALGAALDAAYLLWANGGVAELSEQTRTRTSDVGLGVWGVIERQWDFLTFTVPIATVILATLGLVVGRVPTRARLPIWAFAASVLAFAFALPGGSSVHVFWNFWIVGVVAFGVAALVDREGMPRFAAGPILAVAALGLVVDSPIYEEYDRGLEGHAAVEQLGSDDELLVWPTAQGWTWAELQTDRDAQILTDAELAERAIDTPDARVLVVGAVIDRLEPPATWRAIEEAAGTESSHVLIAAVDLVEAVSSSRPLGSVDRTHETAHGK